MSNSLLSRELRSLPALMLCTLCFASRANAASAAPADLAATGMLQVVFSLMLVLAAIVATAWIVRRFAIGAMGNQHRLKVVGGVMVGSREKVVIVELEGNWLVLGVTSSQVNLLQQLPRPTEPEVPAAVPPFASWLQRALQSRASTPRP
jgi:flagellar protein FliO/FliZ